MATFRHDKQSGKWLVDFKRGTLRKRLKFGTRREAEDFKRELLLRKEGKASNLERVLLKEKVAEYLAKVTSKKSPYSQYFEPLVLNHFSDVFDGFYLDEISLMELESYQADLNKTILGQTVNRRFNVIRHFFQKYVDDGKCLKENPTAKLANLKSASLKAKRALSKEELTALLTASSDWLRDVLWFIVETGVRRSQAVFLRWSAIDWSNGQVHIESSEGFENKNRKIHSLPITADLQTLLRGV